MKYLRIFSIALPAVMLLVLAGCSDELNKSDYNYFPNAKSTTLPTLTMAVSNPSGTTVDFTGTVNLASYPDSAILDRGCMCSTDSLFRSGVVVKTVEDNLLSGVVEGLEGNTNYYARAYVFTNDGIAFSHAVRFKTRNVRVLANYTLDSLLLKKTDYSSIDKDGDGFDWSWAYYDADQTQMACYSYSYDDANGALLPENYLLFPAVSIPSAGNSATVSVRLEPADAKYPSEVFKIVVSENPITADNCQSATTLLVDTLKTQTDPEQLFSVNLPDSYMGKTAYIALCHYNCSDNYALIFKGHKVIVTF